MKSEYTITNFISDIFIKILFIFSTGLLIVYLLMERYDSGYRRGQIDAAIGMQYYNLVKQSDSTLTREFQKSLDKL